MINVDLPLPVLPINAVVSPGRALKLTLLITSSSAPGYLNETFLNSIVPFSSWLNVCKLSESLTTTSTFKTSDTR